jgi:hypothetical protein
MIVLVLFLTEPLNQSTADLRRSPQRSTLVEALGERQMGQSRMLEMLRSPEQLAVPAPFNLVILE